MFDDVKEVATYDIVLPLDLSLRTLLEVCDFDHVDNDLVKGEFPSVIRGDRKLTVYLYPVDGNVTQNSLSAELQKRGLRVLEFVEILTLVARFNKLPERGAAIVVPSPYSPSEVLGHYKVACIKRATSNGERWLIKELMGSSVNLKFLLPVTHHR